MFYNAEQTLLQIYIELGHWVPRQQRQSAPSSLLTMRTITTVLLWSSLSLTSLALPPNYDDIDMSIDQPSNEKVDIRFTKS